MTDPVKSIVLNFSQGSSDKTYQAQIKSRDDGYVVEFQFGKRGGPLQSGCKTQVPVSIEAAEKVFSKLVSEKMGKGYSPSESGVAYQDTSNQHRVSGILPQLSNPITDEQVKAYLDAPAWCMQRKHDGVRAILKVEGATVTGINRKGLTMPLPQSVVSAAIDVQWHNDFVLDGELVGETLFAFDVLRHDGVDTTTLPLSVRLNMLESYPETGAIRRCETYRTSEEKQRALSHLRESGAEGVVMKHLSSLYKPGRPNSMGESLKLKFVVSASVRVCRVNNGKRSVGMELLDENGNWIEVGNLSIPANQPIPAALSIAEVKYLYAFRGGSLFQPVYLGVRDDIDAQECTTAQLQYKGEGSGRIAA